MFSLQQECRAPALTSLKTKFAATIPICRLYQKRDVPFHQKQVDAVTDPHRRNQAPCFFHFHFHPEDAKLLNPPSLNPHQVKEAYQT